MPGGCGPGVTTITFTGVMNWETPCPTTTTIPPTTTSTSTTSATVAPTTITSTPAGVLGESVSRTASTAEWFFVKAPRDHCESGEAGTDVFDPHQETRLPARAA